MLRGPQTPGELKQRTERMFRFAELDGVHATLQRLVERQLAVRLERRPGQKEERYSQLLHDDSQSQTVAGLQWEHAQPEPACELQSPEGRRELPAKDAGSANPLTLEGLHLRVERLEREVAELRAGTRGPH